MQVVNIRSEESINQEISHQIQDLAKSNELSITLSTSTSIESSTELSRRVQLGEITPFEADLKKTSNSSSSVPVNATAGLLDFEQYLRRQAEFTQKRKQLKQQLPSTTKNKPVESKICTKKRKRISKTVNNSNQSPSLACDASTPVLENEKSREVESGSEYIPSDDEYSDYETHHRKTTKIKRRTTVKKRILDDGDETLYKKRVNELNPNKINLRTVDNLFKVPKSIWKKLYEYQKVSVRWLWELHSRGFGGLLGDEMGLGKTVQVIAFFAGLDCSELLSDGGRFRGLGPTLIVCPATLLEQWIQHFHDWWPSMRIVTLHQLGTYQGEPEDLIESIKPGGIVLTSYSGVLRNAELLLPFQWHYVVLDEGHKIRNPQAKVTQMVKKICTPHRLLLTGSPMQNSLKELWSLFDFILPGKLGTLDAFNEHCATPITRGGYSNASSLQEATALQVATMLKDAITPYMLRRTKNDVKHHLSLPEKNEQVLFCSLTREQSDLYKEYLSTDMVNGIIHDRSSGGGDRRHRAKLLVALTMLRKICNHPDLYIYSNTPEESDEDIEAGENIDLENFGYWKKSGKMTVVRSLLKMWKRQGHRVLLFSQGRQMMHILEGLLQRAQYSYLRLDGTTPIGERQRIIKNFNENDSYFVFISTTRVGGLGINLTGADRVVIYDPDWNPATDAQARERAWRIGQDKQVTIYRLITVGTIEEKIYHRQIFKLLLSNRVLEDPRQRRLFQTSDLTELLNLNEPIDGKTTESDRLFGKSTIKSSDTKKNSSSKLNKDEKRKRKAEKISALFEGEKISFLVGRRLGGCTKDEQVIDDDNYVLNKLFSKTSMY